MKCYSRMAAEMGVVFAMLIICGCSHREAPPMTPSENAATPTYRSVTNSWEIDSAPRFTQSGVNGGEPATLPAIPSPARFSENVPLAFSVYGAIHTDPKIYSRYISVYAKGSTIKLLGTANKSEIAKIIQDAKKVSGVNKIENLLEEK